MTDRDSNYQSRESGHRNYDDYGRREFGNNGSYGREDHNWGRSSRFHSSSGSREYRPNHDLSPKRRKVVDYEPRGEDYKEREHHNSRFSDRWTSSSASSGWRYREPQSRSDTRREGGFSERDRRLSRSGDRHGGYYYGRDRDENAPESPPPTDKTTTTVTTPSSRDSLSQSGQNPGASLSTSSSSSSANATTPYRDRDLGSSSQRLGSSGSKTGESDSYYQQPHRSYSSSYYPQKDYEFGRERGGEKEYYAKPRDQRASTGGNGGSGTYGDYKFGRYRDYPRQQYSRGGSGTYGKESRDYDYPDTRRDDYDDYGDYRGGESYGRSGSGGYQTGYSSYHNRKFDKDEYYYSKYEKEPREGSGATSFRKSDPGSILDNPEASVSPLDEQPVTTTSLDHSDSKSEESRQLTASASNDSQDGSNDQPTQSLPPDPPTPTIEPKKKRLGWGRGLAVFEKKDDEPVEPPMAEDQPEMLPPSENSNQEKETIGSWSPTLNDSTTSSGLQSSASLLPEPVPMSIAMPTPVAPPSDPRLKMMTESSSGEQQAPTPSVSPDITLEQKPEEPKIILPAKEEVLSGIEKLDAEISQTESTIQRIKRATGPKKSGSVVINSSFNTHGYISTENLIAAIYQQNQERAQQASEELNRLNSSIPKEVVVPLYKQPHELKIYQENLEKHKSIRHLVASLVHKRRVEAKEKEKTLVEKYKKTRDSWKKKVLKYEEKQEKKAPPKKEVPVPESPTITASGRRTTSSSRSRAAQNPTGSPSLNFGGKPNSKLSWSDVVRSEADFDNILDQLREEANKDPNSKYLKTIAKVPPMVMKEFKIPVFIDRNGRLEDPMQQERERKLLNMWTEDEKSIFLRKYLQHPKNFSKIATFLENKSTADVIWYYYNFKRTLDLKNRLLEQQKKKGYRGRGSASEEQHLVKSKSSMLRSNVQEYAEKQHYHKDYAPMPVASPTIASSSSSADSSTSSMWSESEKSIFMDALTKYGKDFKAIAQLVGSKNQFQCKNFFNNSKKKLGLEKLVEQSGTAPPPPPPQPPAPVVVKRKPEPEPEIVEPENPKDEQAAKKVRIATCWSPEEKDLFLKYFRLFGKDWKKIGDNIPSKTQNQIRNFFQNSKHKLGLLQIEANRLKEQGSRSDLSDSKLEIFSENSNPLDVDEVQTMTRRRKRGIVIQDDDDQEQIIVEDETQYGDQPEPGEKSQKLTTYDLLAKETDLPDEPEVVDNDDSDNERKAEFDRDQVEYTLGPMSLQTAEDLEESSEEEQEPHGHRQRGDLREDAYDLPPERAHSNQMEVSGDTPKVVFPASVAVAAESLFALKTGSSESSMDQQPTSEDAHPVVVEQTAPAPEKQEPVAPVSELQPEANVVAMDEEPAPVATTLPPTNIEQKSQETEQVAETLPHQEPVPTEVPQESEPVPQQEPVTHAPVVGEPSEQPMPVVEEPITTEAPQQQEPEPVAPEPEVSIQEVQPTASDVPIEVEVQEQPVISEPEPVAPVVEEPVVAEQTETIEPVQEMVVEEPTESTSAAPTETVEIPVEVSLPIQDVGQQSEDIQVQEEPGELPNEPSTGVVVSEQFDEKPAEPVLIQKEIGEEASVSSPKPTADNLYDPESPT